LEISLKLPQKPVLNRVEVNNILDYMTADSSLPPYMPYPRFLLDMDLTHTAKLLYALLLDRATLSQKNGWMDEYGRLYIVFPIEKISTALDKSRMTVKNALNELTAAGLIERRRQGFSLPNRIYVKLPGGQETVPMTDRKLSSIGTENCPSDGQKTVLTMDRKLSPNNLSINNLRKNDMRGAREARSSFGRYQNVHLTQTEYLELQAELSSLDSLIEQLSSYMQSESRTYADHAATLRRWAKNGYGQKPSPKTIPDYTCKEDESL